MALNNILSSYMFHLLLIAYFVNGRPQDSANEGPTKISLTYGVGSGLGDSNKHFDAKADYVVQGTGLGDSNKHFDAKADYVVQGTQLFSGPPTKIESAVLEQESLLSKKDTVYTGLHEGFANVFGHKPVVDTLKPHEKYGNDGEPYRTIGKFVVGKAEGVAKLINHAVDVPYNAFKFVVRTTSDKLSHLGAKIVGIEK